MNSNKYVWGERPPERHEWDQIPPEQFVLDDDPLLLLCRDQWDKNIEVEGIPNRRMFILFQVHLTRPMTRRGYVRAARYYKNPHNQVFEAQRVVWIEKADVNNQRKMANLILKVYGPNEPNQKWQVRFLEHGLWNKKFRPRFKCTREFRETKCPYFRQRLCGIYHIQRPGMHCKWNRKRITNWKVKAELHIKGEDKKGDAIFEWNKNKDKLTRYEWWEGE